MDNDFVNEYSNLIYKIAHTFTGYKNKEDLYQAGYKGLIMAYSKFDPKQNVKFSTYAYQYIFGEMSKFIREDYGIKVGRNLKRIKSQIERSRLILEQELMREPTDTEIYTYLGIDEFEFKEALESVFAIQSLDQPIASSGKEFTLYDTVGSNELDMETMLAFKEELKKLTPFERNIIEERYICDLSQSEVAIIHGMTQVQVSREEKKIKEKIKSHMVA